MTFEHIVQINDLTKPELPVLTRFQVWEGLVLRARRLGRFLSASITLVFDAWRAPHSEHREPR